MPVIPGINDDEANLEATARFLAPLAGVRKVDLLPYHRTGEAKVARLGQASVCTGAAPHPATNGGPGGDRSAPGASPPTSEATHE